MQTTLDKLSVLTENNYKFFIMHKNGMAENVAPINFDWIFSSIKAITIVDNNGVAIVDVFTGGELSRAMNRIASNLLKQNRRIKIKDATEALQIVDTRRDATGLQQLQALAFLVRDGLIWSLQGWYVGAAKNAIAHGLISKDGKICWQKAKQIYAV